VEDPEQTIEFPPGTMLDQVADRIVAILQDAAQRRRLDSASGWAFLGRVYYTSRC
jgi:hypothetical protein